MRCYVVTAKDDDGETVATRYAGTSASAREARDTLVSTFLLKKKDVSIEQTEVPVQKDQLLEFINEFLGAQDQQVEE